MFDGLLPDTVENRQLLKLLYRTAEFHAFAKLRFQSDDTIEHLTDVTVSFGKLVRQFKDGVCEKHPAVELPSEAARRVRRAQAQDNGVASETPSLSAASRRRPRELNLSTYKFHSLGDYASFIRIFGPTDGYSTQVVSHALLSY